jgi:hypothetical protein
VILGHDRRRIAITLIEPGELSANAKTIQKRASGKLARLLTGSRLENFLQMNGTKSGLRLEIPSRSKMILGNT